MDPMEIWDPTRDPFENICIMCGAYNLLASVCRSELEQDESTHFIEEVKCILLSQGQVKKLIRYFSEFFKSLPLPPHYKEKCFITFVSMLLRSYSRVWEVSAHDNICLGLYSAFTVLSEVLLSARRYKGSLPGFFSSLYSLCIEISSFIIPIKVSGLSSSEKESDRLHIADNHTLYRLLKYTIEVCSSIPLPLLVFPFDLITLADVNEEAKLIVSSIGSLDRIREVYLRDPKVPSEFKQVVLDKMSSSLPPKPSSSSSSSSTPPGPRVNVNTINNISSTSSSTKYNIRSFPPIKSNKFFLSDSLYKSLHTVEISVKSRILRSIVSNNPISAAKLAHPAVPYTSARISSVSSVSEDSSDKETPVVAMGSLMSASKTQKQQSLRPDHPPKQLDIAAAVAAATAAASAAKNLGLGNKVVKRKRGRPKGRLSAEEKQKQKEQMAEMKKREEKRIEAEAKLRKEEEEERKKLNAKLEARRQQALKELQKPIFDVSSDRRSLRSFP
ncbi:hypothetical protein ADUPG1_013379, partial [Aduncisulcus paluster]